MPACCFGRKDKCSQRCSSLESSGGSPSDWNPNASSAAYKAFQQVCRRDAKGAADPISQRLAVRSAATSPKLAATSAKLSDNHCYLVSHCASRSKRVTLVEYYSSKQTEVQFEISSDARGFWLGEPGQTSI
jgi:hypothetical protein